VIPEIFGVLVERVRVLRDEVDYGLLSALKSLKGFDRERRGVRVQLIVRLIHLVNNVAAEGVLRLLYLVMNRY
jgi:hypothetical protein